MLLTRKCRHVRIENHPAVRPHPTVAKLQTYEASNVEDLVLDGDGGIDDEGTLGDGGLLLVATLLGGLGNLGGSSDSGVRHLVDWIQEMARDRA